MYLSRFCHHSLLFCSSPFAVWVFKSSDVEMVELWSVREKQWLNTKNMNRPYQKRPLERQRFGREDNIRVFLIELSFEIVNCVADSRWFSLVAFVLMVLNKEYVLKIWICIGCSGKSLCREIVAWDWLVSFLHIFIPHWYSIGILSVCYSCVPCLRKFKNSYLFDLCT
jgi:hypothetical protein